MDDYYVFQSNYYLLKGLAEKLRTPNTSSNDLIKYMKKHQIDPNSYLTTFHSNPSEAIYVPIYWQCVQTPMHVKFFKYLQKSNADLNKIPDCTNSKKFHHALFSCHESYIPELISGMSDLKSTISINLDEQIKGKVITGNIRRILILLKVKAISKQELYKSFKTYPDLYFQVIDVLLDRINLVCRTHNQKEEVTQILLKYVKVFEFLFKFPEIKFNLYKNNTQISESNQISIYQYCANFYLYEIIVILKGHGYDESIHDKITVRYHEDMNPKLVASIRQLLNDQRYVMTCQSLDVEPDSRA